MRTPCYVRRSDCGWGGCCLQGEGKRGEVSGGEGTGGGESDALLEYADIVTFLLVH